MTEYTPTTDALRDLWVDHLLDPLPRAEGIELVPEVQAEFDRWLEQVKADAAATYFEDEVGIPEFDEQTSNDGRHWSDIEEAWNHQGPFMEWLRDRAASYRKEQTDAD